MSVQKNIREQARIDRETGLAPLWGERVFAVPTSERDQSTSRNQDAHLPSHASDNNADVSFGNRKPERSK